MKKSVGESKLTPLEWSVSEKTINQSMGKENSTVEGCPLQCFIQKTILLGKFVFVKHVEVTHG